MEGNGAGANFGIDSPGTNFVADSAADSDATDSAAKIRNLEAEVMRLIRQSNMLQEAKEWAEGQAEA